jgi:hypothetical protein
MKFDKHPATPLISANTVVSTPSLSRQLCEPRIGRELGAHAVDFLMDEVSPRRGEVNLENLSEPYRGVAADRWDFARSHIEEVSSGAGGSSLEGHIGKPSFGADGNGGSPCDGNHSLESRGFDTLPVKANHQPEASLACECGNALLEA